MGMLKKEKLMKQFAKKWKDIAPLTKELIAINTVNPPGNESEIADFLEKRLKRKGIKCKKIGKVKHRKHLIAWIGRGKNELMVETHADTVPPNDMWTTDPWKGIQKNGKIYGLGAEDNKGPIAASVVALETLKRFEKELKGKFSILVAADEELASSVDLKYLLRKKKIHPKNVIVADVCKSRQIGLGEKSILRIRIVSYGKAAHGSRPEEGVNAINNMGKLLVEMEKLRMCGGNQLFSKPTINVGKIYGGKIINMVPTKCSASFDIRYLPNQKEAEIFQDIKKVIKKVEKKNKHAKFEIALLHRDKGFQLDKENELIESIQKNHELVLGKKAAIIGLSGGTDARKFLRSRINAISFSPGDKLSHKANEYIDLKQLKDFTKTVLFVAKDLLTES